MAGAGPLPAKTCFCCRRGRPLRVVGDPVVLEKRARRAFRAEAGAEPEVVRPSARSPDRPRPLSIEQYTADMPHISRPSIGPRFQYRSGSVSRGELTSTHNLDIGHSCLRSVPHRRTNSRASTAVAVVDRTTSELAPQLSRRPSRVRSTTFAGAASTAADACALLRSLLGFELLLLERDDDDPQRLGDGQGGV